MSQRDSDVIVVGGGLVGACVAWGLACSSRRVTMLDEGDIARRAARANFGLVWVQGKGLGYPAYTSWTRASATDWPRLHETLKQETGVDVGYTRPGGFSLRLSEREMQRGAAVMAEMLRQSGNDYPHELLDHAETKRRLPQIGKDVVGSTYSPMDGHVNSLRLFRALHIGLHQRGAHYLPGHCVETITPRQGGGFRLDGSWGSMEAEKLVLAAGVDNQRLAPMVGLNIPLVPSRGQIIVTEKAAPFLHNPIGTLRQTDEGGVMIGESKEAAEEHDRARNPVTAVLAERAIRMFPLIGRLNAVRVWTGFRVVTTDGFPVYAQSRQFPGAFVTACHSGVTLAANHALTVPGYIAAGAIPETLSAFSDERFHVPAAA